MKLSKRLLKITEYVPKNSVVGDVGTDHGYIPIYLVENKIVEKVIATDISNKSLDKTIELVDKYNLSNKIETRLGNGLDVFSPSEIDTVIFAGMGGILISKLLAKNIRVCNSIKHFIFQPMQASEKLRFYLLNNNFKIIDESLIKEDGRIFEIIYAIRGEDSIDDKIFLEVGRKLFVNKDPLLKEFLINKIKYNENIIKKLTKDNNNRVKLRLKELKNKNKKYKEVIKEYEGI